jgi:hypothetical protein
MTQNYLIIDRSSSKVQAQAREISSQVMGEGPLIQGGGFKPFLEA